MVRNTPLPCSHLSGLIELGHSPGARALLSVGEFAEAQPRGSNGDGSRDGLLCAPSPGSSLEKVDQPKTRGLHAGSDPARKKRRTGNLGSTCGGETAISGEGRSFGGTSGATLNGSECPYGRLNAPLGRIEGPNIKSVKPFKDTPEGIFQIQRGSNRRSRSKRAERMLRG